jgi:hypothetical protein
VFLDINRSRDGRGVAQQPPISETRPDNLDADG